MDTIKKVFSDWAKQNPQCLPEVFSWFYQHDNFWRRRLGLILQLGYRTQTDVALLEQAIAADVTTDEFFIQKAIGWALRDYSKTNPAWVKTILARYPLSALAVKEASKYL